MKAEFEDSICKFPEPYSQLVRFAAENIGKDYFSNFIIAGECLQDEKASINAWSVIGLAPRYDGFLECHAAGCNEHDEAGSISKFKKAVLDFDLLPNSLIAFLRAKIQENIELDKPLVLAIVSLHQTLINKKEFAVLWGHPAIHVDLLKIIVKKVFNERF